MARNGSGSYSLPATTASPAVANTLIESAEFNTLTADIATAITNSLAANGETTVTANLPMATYKHTGVGASSARTDYARVAEVVDGTHEFVASDTGSANAYAIAPAPAITAYVAGQEFSFVPANDNTTASTLAVSGLAAKNIKLTNGADPSAADIDASGVAKVKYDGTNFVLLNPAYAVIVADVTGTATALSDLGGDIAGLTAGGIGTYAFARRDTNDIAFGTSVAGSTLYPTSAARAISNPAAAWSVDAGVPASFSGTWRCMGRYDGSDGNAIGATLWERIA